MDGRALGFTHTAAFGAQRLSAVFNMGRRIWLIAELKILL